MADSCEFPLRNATSQEVREILHTTKVVAMVGLSDNPERDSYRVAAYLQAHGYRVIPVNPNVREIWGERAYGRLEDVSGPIDVVDIFRKPEAVPEIVDAAIRVGARVVWMQEWGSCTTPRRTRPAPRASRSSWESA